MLLERVDVHLGNYSVEIDPIEFSPIDTTSTTPESERRHPFVVVVVVIVIGVAFMPFVVVIGVQSAPG